MLTDGLYQYICKAYTREQYSGTQAGCTVLYYLTRAALINRQTKTAKHKAEALGLFFAPANALLLSGV